MVLENPFIKPTQQTHSQGSQVPEIGIGAKVSDRVLSFLIDILIWLPLAQLLFASHKKQLLTQLLLESQISTDLMIQGIVFASLYCAVYILVNALFVSTLRGTPGQLLMGLRVVSFESRQHLSFLQAILRAFVFVVSLLFLGWPLVASLTHKRRRCFHDLASDSIVISTKKLVVLNEVKQWEPFVKMYYTITFSVLLTIVFAVGSSLQSKSKLKVFSFMSEVKSKCPDLPEGTNFYDSAVSAFLVDYADQDCLLSFSDSIFSSPEGEFDPSWAYFSKYLLFSDDIELKTQYEKALCKEPESKGCQWIKLKSGNRDAKALSLIDKSLTTQILKIQYSLKKMDYSRAYKMAKDLPDHEAFTKVKVEGLALFDQSNFEPNGVDEKIKSIFKNIFGIDQSVSLLQAQCDLSLIKTCHPEAISECKELAGLSHYWESESASEKKIKLARTLQASICDGAVWPENNQVLSELSLSERKEFLIFSKLRTYEFEDLSKELSFIDKNRDQNELLESIMLRAYSVLSNHPKYQNSQSRWAKLMNVDFVNQNSEWFPNLKLQSPARQTASEPKGEP